MAGQPASKPNLGYVVSISRKFIMPSTTIIKKIPYWEVGNISHTHTKGQSDKKMSLNTTDSLVLSQWETLQWDNIGDMSTSKKGK